MTNPLDTITPGQILRMVAQASFREMTETDRRNLAEAQPGSLIAEYGADDDFQIILAPDGTMTVLYYAPDGDVSQVDLNLDQTGGTLERVI